MSSLFSSYDKLDFQLKAPFDELFARSAQESGYAVRGLLSYTPDDQYRCDAKETLWNIAVLARECGRSVPLMYDFDEAGMATGSERYLTAFFDAIVADDAFYRPVVLREKATAYADAEGENPACPRAATAPIGTPVSARRNRNGRRVQVLDALWHWTGLLKCDAIRRGAVWIDERALGTRYPQ